MVVTTRLGGFCERVSLLEEVLFAVAKEVSAEKVAATTIGRLQNSSSVHSHTAAAKRQFFCLVERVHSSSKVAEKAVGRSE